MRWLVLSLAGPGIWAAGFSLVYALHGTGCAREWTGAPGMLGASLHDSVLWAGWLVTMAGGVLWLLRLSTEGRQVTLPLHLPRAGAWIGLGATVFTLLPVALASSC